MLRMHYGLYTMSWVLLLVFAAFYVLGCVIRLMLNKFGMQQEKKEAEQQEAAAQEAEQQEEKQQSEDGAVIEKQ